LCDVLKHWVQDCEVRTTLLINIREALDVHCSVLSCL